MSTLEWASIATPVGPVSVGYGDAGVAQARFGPPPGGRARRRAGGSRAAAAARQLAEYFCGQRKEFDLPLDWSGFGPAQRQVLRLLYDDVGYGQTVTYGTLAAGRAWRSATT